ncbi:hypothetical protein DBR22_17710 [Arthrobacter sp. HMWF013]|nr:hypothetical protein DBR22_17710 [Arthrobacter sp. HMWF013]
MAARVAAACFMTQGAADGRPGTGHFSGSGYSQNYADGVRRSMHLRYDDGTRGSVETEPRVPPSDVQILQCRRSTY